MLYLFGEITSTKAENIIRGIHQGERELTLCSEGGDVYAALAIYDAMRVVDMTVIATGFVASSAVLILLGANERIASPNVRFMTHPVRLDSEESQASTAECRAMQEKIETIFMQRTGMSGTDAAAMLSQELVFGVETASAFGIIHQPDERLRLSS